MALYVKITYDCQILLKELNILNDTSYLKSLFPKVSIFTLKSIFCFPLLFSLEIVLSSSNVIPLKLCIQGESEKLSCLTKTLKYSASVKLDAILLTVFLGAFSTVLAGVISEVRFDAVIV
ncbi:uncharacterized protein EV154DRAFT_495918 [Mucor mucedo]|uniref:uncharacterized protein n=1 Tax=Mucor mucedo TaxID=29922 RepID=UPI002220985D|nr:uncharacterized protein EV154DRAFT_510140 [Mucor mucedo]XP_051461844.1 uncharacterized protein EV154DRAFT_495918 [Mucor mucedo]KAI7890961.1 hypothetical protein EV154DRAFT_510140 [Mucor mucedo]KAI7895429.1 hypothetical protein EV154DRAFT_495918 [Mucor mucedo]